MRNVHCRSQHCKGVGEYAYTNFFYFTCSTLSNKGLVTLYKYTRACRCRNLVGIACSSGGNKLINKCYSARKKFEIFSGDMCKNYFVAQAVTQSYRWFAVYQSLHHIYFNGDRKRANLCFSVLTTVAHANMHCG